ncbi:DUF1990 domain-containing protein [Streptomyces sp. NBC_01387]|uniref:DUF1990 family protein n=1 Tax=unclassified Streptomyces TaxID=2593676 RepID=UPI002023BC4E|nr:MULTISPECIES: DUF1990 domain-containing protein [unclassified Streptomyces]WSC24281.1 DUF1990 domain-containing protein [Streptomyces sp. NBC_01766]WSV58166.1 DUF1990 domain-containing protein [Streptomyces sp. NBC_01014]
MDQFTYAQVGASREGRCPEGFQPLRVSTRLGTGEDLVRRAGEAVLSWRMHRAVGVSMETQAPVAIEGARVVVGLGVGSWRLRAPCRVVWTAQEPRRVGFAYGTLPGHPECGEEAFVVERRDDGVVWLTVSAFSRPDAWWARAAGSLVPVFQRAYARRCGRVLRRLAAQGGATATS